MGKETESGRRSPSIIARLMGLDGLPTSHNISRKHKRLSDSRQRGSSSSSFSNDSKTLDSQSHKKCATGQQSFKDVYEVKDRSHMETRSSTSIAASNRSDHEDEMGFIRRKFVDAKRLYTNDNFYHSKEFYDAVDVLHSNKDLLLRFLEEPDLLFSKHLRDLYHVPDSCYGCNVGPNSNNALKSNIDVIGSQTNGEASRKIDISHCNISHCNNDLTSWCKNMVEKHGTGWCNLNFLGEGTDSASSNPTNIVVLKPNLGKAVKHTKSTPSVSPRGLSSAYEITPDHRVVEARSKRSKDDNYDSYGRKSRESRELAREITRQMKNQLGTDFLYFYSSGSKGYTADESSHDTSENESSYESEVTILGSQNSSNRIYHKKSSSLQYMESSVNMEAKKRLSERWKMTHRSQEIGEPSKGSTLAEMLATPDLDIRRRSPDGYFCRFGRNDGTSELFSPLGISSRDGLKGGYIQNLSRSKSLPNSVNHYGSPKSNLKCQAITPEKFLVRREHIGSVRTKPIKRDFKRQEESFLENKKPSDRKFQSFSPVKVVDNLYEVQANGDMKNTINGKDSSDVKTVILETPSCRHDTGLSVNEDIPAKESRSCASPRDGSSSSGVPSLPQVGGSSYLQCTATHLESPASSKESEQPSPVSVLEAPFVEDSSSGSECFERVSAELNGLRMQLRLLKQESEVHDEETMLISSNECADESPELYDDENYLTCVGECWESRYLADVWAFSGLDKINSEYFLAAWYSPDCPIAPWVFEDLEKRYSELESCSRSDRKLLYDNINARIMEMGQQFVDLDPWVKKKQGKCNPKWSTDVLKIELEALVKKHQNKTKENELNEMIVSDMGWMMLEEDISGIGRVIEALLIDDLVSEVFDV